MQQHHMHIYISLLLTSSFWCQVCNGATYVNIDMLVNRKDGSKMLLIEGNLLLLFFFFSAGFRILFSPPENIVRKLDIIMFTLVIFLNFDWILYHLNDNCDWWHELEEKNTIAGRKRYYHSALNLCKIYPQ